MKLSVNIPDDLEAFLAGAADTLTALLGRRVSRSQVLLVMAAEGKPAIERALASPEGLTSIKSMKWIRDVPNGE